MFYIIFMFFFGILTLIMVRSHFLMCLLSIELLFIYLFFYSFFFFNFFFFDYYFCILFLVFGVCDGVIGLSLLVYLVRKTGNDYFSSLSLC
uniref:NADH dehydrogenase subunit 4L n=1 Tax=Suva longipenna TaxID=3081115 RepID=UPI002A7F00AE|nr:NADH dehydrogenase subunit 4L [Suva longipenna]WOW98940.1 NADH dehydrogenase subunit 4L [Suva longipenna]